MSLKSPIAAGLLVLAGLQGAAAQSYGEPVVPVPVRPQGFVFVAPDAPTVLEATGPGPVAPVSRPDLTGPAVPVAQVMNGGGFGLSGVGYYYDQHTEGPLNARPRPRDYVIAPGYIVPPRN